jgi:transcription elongation factor Elf1
MGLYDILLAECPSCGAAVEFQTKSGHCEMREYRGAAPINVFEGTAATACSNCGEWWELDKPTGPWPIIIKHGDL